jgi:cytochrome c oxidase subunit 2
VESFDPVTRQGLSITNLFWIELAITAVLLALVLGVLTTALTRFRARATDVGEPPQVHGNRRLEIIWTVTPAVTLFVMFIGVIVVLRTVDAEQPNAEPIVVIDR